MLSAVGLNGKADLQCFFVLRVSDVLQISLDKFKVVY